MPMLPPFLSLLPGYPTDDQQSLKQSIGGKVNADWITNTCAIRISAALNGCGAPHLIPPPDNAHGLSVISGASGRWFAYRVTELSKYLRVVYGAPSRIVSGTPEEMMTRLAGKSGIIQFDVSGWSDATGHLDLWDGTACSLKCYFLGGPRPATTSVRLWEC